MSQRTYCDRCDQLTDSAIPPVLRLYTVDYHGAMGREVLKESCDLCAGCLASYEKWRTIFKRKVPVKDRVL